MDEMLAGASRLTRGSSPVYHHPNIKKLLVVTTDAVMRLAFQGANNPVFGNLQAVLFETQDEALTYARVGK
jgi:hypothetical protein